MSLGSDGLVHPCLGDLLSGPLKIIFVAPIPVSGFGTWTDFCVGISKDEPDVQFRVGVSDIDVFLAVLYGKFAFDLDIDIPDLDVRIVGSLFGWLDILESVLLVGEGDAPDVQVRGNSMFQ